MTRLLYRRLDVERNKRWSPKIEAILKSPGVRFVDVGVAHILDSDGVPALFKNDGCRVEQVQ
jgi:uncharacterized protein YbaP (TraB family)